MMLRWTGRVALVTGASGGIGASICEHLVKAGLKVVGLARNIDKIKAHAVKLTGEAGKLYAVKADVTKDDQVLAAFSWVRKNLGGVDILINNAGQNIQSTLLDGTPEDWRNLLDLNVVALCLCTKEAVKSMRERGVDDGHIIHISSTLGQKVGVAPMFHFYCATKGAVRMLTEGLNRELRELNTNIKASCICPGNVKTDFISRAANSKNITIDADAVYNTQPYIEASDIAQGVLVVLGTPPGVVIPEITIQPLKEIIK